MPRYVCEYEEVTKAGKDICKVSDNLINDAKSYVEKLAETVSEWTGEAKDAFAEAESTRIKVIGNTAAYLQNYGCYVQAVSEAIKQTDEDLSSLKA